MPIDHPASSALPESEQRPTGISAIEWAVAFIGLGVLLAVLAFLLMQATERSALPPDLYFDVLSIEPVHNGHVVIFSVMNAGDVAAADVRIVGQLRDDTTLVEEQEMTLDYAPPHSTRRGGLFFSHDPGAGELLIRASGYMDP